MQIHDLKKQLQEEPEDIKVILEHWNFTNVKIHPNYISFGRGEGGNPKSLCLYYNNDYLGYVDFVNNEKGDLFSLIIKQRHIPFFSVIQEIESLLGISTDYTPSEDRLSFFGGIYDSVSDSITDKEPDPIDEGKLNRFLRVPNLRFLKDGISIKAQKKFNIRYEEETGNIVIPIYAPTGYLMGIKARVNRKRAPDESKYFYIEKCQKNKTLYGYSQNYEHLVNADCIYIFEAEKSVMQAYSFGEQKCVAMAGSFLSVAQARLIIGLAPKKIVLAMDKGISVNRSGVLWSNVEILQNEMPDMLDIPIEVVDMTWDLDVPDKWSPTDLGKEDFYRVIEEDVISWKEIEDGF